MTSSPQPPVSAPWSTRNGAFVVTDAGAPGLTRKRTRATRFLAPSRGIRVDRRVEDIELALLTAAALPRPDGGVLTDVSAARLWRLPLPPWFDAALLPEHGSSSPSTPTSVAVRPDRARLQRKGTTGRRLRLLSEHVTEHRGVAVTTPARTWLDCAQVLRLDHTVAMGDVVLRRSGMDELEEMVRWGRGRRGVRTARRALPILDARTGSPGESRVRAYLAEARLPRPECNRDVITADGWLARVDLAWPEQRVAVEYDGAVHLDEHQRRRDAARLNLLQRAGWLVIVLTADDLRRPWQMVQLVAAALRERSRTP